MIQCRVFVRFAESSGIARSVMHADISLPSVPREGEFVYFQSQDHRQPLRAPVMPGIWYHANKSRVDFAVRDQPADQLEQLRATFRLFGFTDSEPPYPWEADFLSRA